MRSIPVSSPRAVVTGARVYRRHPGPESRRKLIKHAIKWLADGQNPVTVRRYIAKGAPDEVIKAISIAALNLKHGPVRLPLTEEPSFGNTTRQSRSSLTRGNRSPRNAGSYSSASRKAVSCQFYRFLHRFCQARLVRSVPSLSRNSLTVATSDDAEAKRTVRGACSGAQSRLRPLAHQDRVS